MDAVHSNVAHRVLFLQVFSHLQMIFLFYNNSDIIIYCRETVLSVCRGTGTNGKCEETGASGVGGDTLRLGWSERSPQEGPGRGRLAAG